MSVHVLGIETSCDDTGVAIVRHDGKVLGNCLHSQLVRHLTHGGIIPMVAKEYHVDSIDKTARRAMEESGLESVANNIDAVAVSTRPGLESSLQVGLNYARQLAKKYSKPLIPVHHMQAHALMPLLENRNIRFPFLTLLLSGGHCLIAICERHDIFHLLGQSMDDAPGDLLDKVARRTRLRNLGPPFDRISGGASIELLANQPGANKYKYFNDDTSIPMLRNNGCDMSFSGYKGQIEKISPIVDELWLAGERDRLIEVLGDVCSSLQRAILTQVFRKLHRALLYYRMHWCYKNPQAFSPTASGESEHLGFEIRRMDQAGFEWPDIVLSGGVAANSYLVDKIKSCCDTELESDEPVKVFAPSKSLCSDNGLMVAWNGMLRFLNSRALKGDDLVNESIVNSLPKEDSIIYNSREMDSINVLPVSPIGHDITELTRAADFKLPKRKNPELKMRPLRTQ